MPQEFNYLNDRDVEEDYDTEGLLFTQNSHQNPFSSDSYDHTRFGHPIKRKFVVLFILGVLCSVGVGVLIGWFSHQSNVDQSENKPQEQAQTFNTVKALLNGLNKENIEKNLKLYTSRPRLAGTAGNYDLINLLETAWKDSGIDKVEVKSYPILLSYPNKTSPNKVQIIDEHNVAIFTSAPYENPLTPEGNDREIVPPYNSFAPAGTVEGDLVYVNYGRIEDFQTLVKLNPPVDVNGKIVIARYGKIFRGDKLSNAALYNASGVILYTDPFDFNPSNSSEPFPKSWWMPETGVQRGTVGEDGDYLTPLYPSTDYAYRLDVGDVNLPKIPCQPISYGDAKHLLVEMDGPDAQMDWQGGLPFSYKIGPGLRNKTLKVRLEVNNFVEIRAVDNVIGYITGSTEPDRYVLLGNHNDAWVFGGVDPQSGTAALTELVRTFGDMLKSGWRPKRTLVFCSWGGEEQGLLGSTEWVEENMKVLYERAVAYINVDYTCEGMYHIVAGTSPLLQDALYEAAKQTPSPTPTDQDKTLYDTWKTAAPMNKSDVNSEPSVYYSLGSGSDQATFYQRAGVPSVDFWNTYKYDILSYPLYHTGYDTFTSYKDFIDPTFTCSLAVTQMWGIVSSNLADATIFPYDVRRYAKALEGFVETLLKQFETKWSKQGVNYDALVSAVHNFTRVAETFHQSLSKVDKNDPLACRIVNDKLMQIERAFIDPEGLPGRRQYKHVIFAPSRYDAYSDNNFPGIVDVMYEIEHNGLDTWDLLKQQVFVATYSIESAGNTLMGIGI